MNTNKYFTQYHSKLMTEGILKAFLCGLATGFAANFIAALATWFAPVNGLWISLGILVAVTLIATPIFYFARFRLNDVKNARRLDSLGLEERLVTMVEFEHDDSIIARLQREDAKRALGTVDRKQIKVNISKSIVAAVICFAILGAGMTTVNALSELGLMPGGDEIIDSIVEEQLTVYVKVSYVVEEGGIIEGDEEQIIPLGTDAATITAVADEGYMFKEWSDGSTDPTRTDRGINEDVVYTAVFIEVGDGDGDSDGDDDGDGEGDEPTDAPSDSSQNQGNSSSGPSDPNSNSNGQMGGGAYDPNNQVIDGETYYRELLEQYQEKAGEWVTEDGNGLTEEMKKIILKYLGIL